MAKKVKSKNHPSNLLASRATAQSRASHLLETALKQPGISDLMAVYGRISEIQGIVGSPRPNLTILSNSTSCTSSIY